MIDGNTLGLKLFIPRISRGSIPLAKGEKRANSSPPRGARGKLADLNRIGIEGKSRHYLKAQPII
jgi:hypothetical protein